jgi:hypothetical protein
LASTLLAGLVALGALALAPSSAAQGAGDLDRNPLSPPDISSPRASLNTFLSEAKAAIAASRVGDPELMHARADRAFQTLATEYSASEADFQRAVDSALHLLEILIRIDLPPADQIPDASPRIPSPACRTSISACASIQSSRVLASMTAWSSGFGWGRASPCRASL